MNKKEKVFKDLFPDKQFIMMKKKGIAYISNDAVDILLKHEKEKTLSEVKKMIEGRIEELEKVKQKHYNEKLKAFEEHSQFEGMCLGLAQETEKIINELEEIISKIESKK